jgi:hypothetical protein
MTCQPNCRRTVREDEHEHGVIASKVQNMRSIRRGQCTAAGKNLGSLGVTNKADAVLRVNGLNGALHQGISLLVWAVSPDVHCRSEVDLSPRSILVGGRHGRGLRQWKWRRSAGLVTPMRDAHRRADAALPVHHPYGCFKRVISRSMASRTKAARLVGAASACWSSAAS